MLLDTVSSEKLRLNRVVRNNLKVRVGDVIALLSGPMQVWEEESVMSFVLVTVLKVPMQWSLETSQEYFSHVESLDEDLDSKNIHEYAVNTKNPEDMQASASVSQGQDILQYEA